MSKTRSMNAFSRGMARAAEKMDERKDELESVNQADEGAREDKSLPAYGNWSRLASKALGEQLEDARESLKQSREDILSGVIAGKIPLQIPRDAIADDVGTDRLFDRAEDSEDTTDSFEVLCENIREKGQRHPIRVRPVDPDWRPDPEDPLSAGEQKFYIQSGRRRLAALRSLGRDPLCFISFSDGDTTLADLEERFFENTVRKNLTVVEKLHSIGMIVAAMPETTMSRIAEILGVSTAYVSRGVAVHNYFDRLSQDLNLPNATTVQIDAALKKYRSDEKSDTPTAIRLRKKRAEGAKIAQSLPFKTRKVRETAIGLRADKSGQRIMTIKGDLLDDTMIERIVEILEQGSEG